MIQEQHCCPISYRTLPVPHFIGWEQIAKDFFPDEVFDYTNL